MKTRANLAISYPLARGTLPSLADGPRLNREPGIEGPLYTVIAYHLPAGAHCVETLVAENATDAAVRLPLPVEAFLLADPFVTAIRVVALSSAPDEVDPEEFAGRTRTPVDVDELIEMLRNRNGDAAES